MDFFSVIDVISGDGRGTIRSYTRNLGYNYLFEYDFGKSKNITKPTKQLNKVVFGS